MSEFHETRGAVRGRPIRTVLFPLILVGVTVLQWLPRFEGPIDLRYDGGVYYILGTSLAQGSGYRLLNEPGQIQAIQYPPLLPGVVAAHQWVLGTDDPEVVGQALRYTYFVLSVLLALAVYAMARLSLSPGYAFVVGLISCLYLFTYFLSDLLFAEVPFCLVTTLFVICGAREQRWYTFLLTATLGAAAFLLRTAGIALLLAWVGESLFRQRWRQTFARAAVALLPIVAWQSYIAQVTASDEYSNPTYEYQRAAYQYYNVSYLENSLLVDPFIPELGRVTPTALEGRIVENLAVMPLSIGEGVSATKNYWDWALYDAEQVLRIDRGSPTGEGRNSWLYAVQKQRRVGRPMLVLVPLTLLGWLVISGLALSCARQRWLVPLYVGTALALITLTPWPGQFTRYVMPLTPFFALALVSLIASFPRAVGRRRPPARLLGTILGGGVIAVVLGVQLYVTWKGFTLGLNETHAEGRRRFFYDEAWRSFDASVAWLETRANPEDVIATVAPHIVYVQTGAKAILPPMENDPAEALRLLDTVPVAYLIVDELTFVDTSDRYVRPMLRRYPERWQLVFGVPGTETRIYKRRGESESSQPLEKRAGTGSPDSTTGTEPPN